MYVPATPAQPAPALAPVGDRLARAPAPLAGAALAPSLKVRRRAAERARRPPRHRRRHALKRTAPAAPGASSRCRRSAATAGARSPTRAPARAGASACATARTASAASACACASPATARPALAPAPRAPERLSPRRRLLVRRRRRPRLRRLADQLHARRRQQDASLRHARHAALRRPLGARARSSTAGRTSPAANSTSPKPPSRRSASATPERSGARAERSRRSRSAGGQTGSCTRPIRRPRVLRAFGQRSCRAWVSRRAYVESPECPPQPRVTHAYGSTASASGAGPAAPPKPSKRCPRRLWVPAFPPRLEPLASGAGARGGRRPPAHPVAAGRAAACHPAPRRPRHADQRADRRLLRAAFAGQVARRLRRVFTGWWRRSGTRARGRSAGAAARRCSRPRPCPRCSPAAARRRGQLDRRRRLRLAGALGQQRLLPRLPAPRSARQRRATPSALPAARQRTGRHRAPQFVGLRPAGRRARPPDRRGTRSRRDDRRDDPGGRLPNNWRNHGRRSYESYVLEITADSWSRTPTCCPVGRTRRPRDRQRGLDGRIGAMDVALTATLALRVVESWLA